MAFVDSKSAPVGKNELNIFSVPPTQIGILRSFTLSYFPKNPLNANGPIIFELPPNPHFTDVSNNTLIMKFKITRLNGDNLLAADQAAPINYIINTAWSQIKLYTAGKLLWDSSDQFAYKAYIQTVLGFGQEAKKTYLRSGFYAEDTAGQMDNPVVAQNLGFAVRQEAVQVVDGVADKEVIGVLQIDPWMHNKLWPPQVPMTLELYRNKNRFLIHCHGAHHYQFVITSMRLQMHMVETIPSLNIAMEKQLAKMGCKYALRRTEVRCLHVNAGRTDVPPTQIHTGLLPRRCLIFFLTSEAYHGHYNLCSFNMQHFDLNKIQLVAGGRLYPEQPYEPDFGHHNFMAPYFALHQSIQSDDGTPCTLTPDQFRQGYTVFCFDLSADSSGSHDHFNIRQHGTVELRLEFANPIANAAGIKVMILLEFDSCLTLDRNRQFYLDYSI